MLGFGFVRFVDPLAAATAVNMMNGVKIVTFFFKKISFIGRT
jgi:RNA recognition motif-containing protein